MEEILIECSPGVSGDMLLGAFHDLGGPKDEIEKKLACFGSVSYTHLTLPTNREV